MDPAEAGGEARRLPVRRTETSLIKDEFDSLRAKFDAEMRQMEEDMARFRSHMQSPFGEHFGRAATGTSSQTSSKTSSRTRTTTTTTTSSKTAEQQLEAAACRDWLEGFANSPMVVGSGEERLLKLRFDVSAYQPDQVEVMTCEERLRVSARRRDTSEHGSVASEYNREFLLPAGVDVDQIKSSLSADGILTVEVPLASAAGVGGRGSSGGATV